MFAVRPLLIITALAGVFANPLQSRQATNTNAAVNAIVDNLDVQIHHNIPNILTMQANGTASDGTVGSQIQQLVVAFNTATTNLKNTPVSSGSTTVSPTNDDISVTFGDVMQQVSTGLSGLTTATVPTFTSMLNQLDPAVAATATQLNTTVPGVLGFVHILMLDAQQFLVKEGAWPLTLAALGF